MSGLRWWWLAFLAALVLLVSAGGFLVLKPAKPAPPPPLPPRVRCPQLDAPMKPFLAGAEDTPVFFTGSAPLTLDGTPARSGPVAPGEHVVRGDGVQLTFRLEPFQPAWFDAEVIPGLGLTLVWLGAACQSCPPALDAVKLDYTRTSAADPDLLASAAAALRANDWRGAAAKLRAVSPKARALVPYRRLAAHVLQATRQPAAALEQLKDLAPAAWTAARATEAARESTLGMQRWNLITEKFSQLLEQFALDAPGPVQLATGRLSELTASFLEASRKQDYVGQDALVKAAEEALAQFVRTLRRTRPDDCDFQARISASL